MTVPVVGPAQWVCECAEPDIHLRFQVYRNGVKHYHRQCASCGEVGGSIAQKDLTWLQRQKAEQVDQELRERKRRERYEHGQLEWQKRRQEFDAERQAALDARRDEYRDYLQTVEWKRRRLAVLKRDDYTCRAQLPGCAGQACQAHHLTYDHLFDEPLFDLVAICRDCHQRLHGRNEDE